MSTKIQPISETEDTVQSATSSISSSTVSPKVSLFAKQSGFLIPKNKLSGSLVPIFRSSKKPGGADVDSEESNKQVLRKTKWAPDLTQDAFVKKGRASAYQTRLDQITQQLKSGILDDTDGHDSPEAQESLDQQSIEKSELELERRDVIGEILKLNPSYKAPHDYKPLLKEDKVVIPIKEYPDRNFIELIFGPAGDTQKRLEKESGAKIRVYGTKADTKKESEITSFNNNETHKDYKEVYVRITSETYEKLDSAVSLIESLITPISANNDPVSKDNPNTVSLGQDTPVLVNQPSGPPAPLMARFQPYPSQWVRPGQPFGQQRPIVSVPNNQQPIFPYPNTRYPGPPRTTPLPPVQISPRHPIPRPVPRFTFPEQPIAPLPPVGFQTRSPNPRPVPALRPHQPGSNDFTFQTNRAQTPLSQPGLRPGSQPGSHFMPPQSPSFRPPPVVQGQMGQRPPPGQMGQQPPPGQMGQRPPPGQMGQRPPPSQMGQRAPGQMGQTGQMSQQPPPGQTGQRPPPGQTGQMGQRPPPGQMGQRPLPGQMGQRPPPSQMGQTGQQPPPGQMGQRPPLGQIGQRPPLGQIGQMGQRPPPGQMGQRPPLGQMGQRPPPDQMGQRPPLGQMGFRPHNFVTNQQFRGNVSYSMGRPGSNPSGPQQVYDPFSPTAAAPRKPGNPQNSRKQESDPEYDDLMESVGVK